MEHQHRQIGAGVPHEPAYSSGGRSGVGQVVRAEVVADQLRDPAAEGSGELEPAEQGVGSARAEGLVSVKRRPSVLARSQCLGLRKIVDEQRPVEQRGALPVPHRGRAGKPAGAGAPRQGVEGVPRDARAPFSRDAGEQRRQLGEDGAQKAQLLERLESAVGARGEKQFLEFVAHALGRRAPERSRRPCRLSPRRGDEAKSGELGEEPAGAQRPHRVLAQDPGAGEALVATDRDGRGRGWWRRRESNPCPRSNEKSDGARLPLPGRDYPPNPLPLRVPWSPPPSRGDIVETAPTRGFPFR